jgi:hypothetical protein
VGFDGLGVARTVVGIDDEERLGEGDGEWIGVGAEDVGEVALADGLVGFVADRHAEWWGTAEQVGEKRAEGKPIGAFVVSETLDDFGCHVGCGAA